MAATKSANSRIRPAVGSIHHTIATVPAPTSSGDRERRQDPQEQVLQGVDVATRRESSSPSAEGGQAGGARRSRLLVHLHAQIGERQKRGVVADQPLAIAEQAAREPKELDADDRHRQGRLLGALGGARDQPSRGRHQADRGRHRAGAEQGRKTRRPAAGRAKASVWRSEARGARSSARARPSRAPGSLMTAPPKCRAGRERRWPACSCERLRCFEPAMAPSGPAPARPPGRPAPAAPGDGPPRSRCASASRRAARAHPARSPVEVGGGLVEQEQRASRRKARASATRWRSPRTYPDPSLTQRGVRIPCGKPTTRLQPGRHDALPHLVGGVGSAEPDVVGDRARRRGAAAGEPTRSGCASVGVEVGQVDAPEGTDPARPGTKPSNTFRSVDLPQPLGPGDGHRSRPGATLQRHVRRAPRARARVEDGERQSTSMAGWPGRAHRSSCPAGAAGVSSSAKTSSAALIPSALA